MGVSTTHRIINLSMCSFSDTYYVWAACGLPTRQDGVENRDKVYTKLPLPLATRYTLFYMPKQSQRILVSPLYNFPLHRGAENLNQAQASQHPAIATPISVKWIEPECLSDSSGMHYPLDNAYH